MKTQYALLTTALTIALTLPVFGQHNHDDMTKTDMKKHDMKTHDMSSMMGKPTADATVGGLHMKVWLITQKQHKDMMKGKMGQMMMRNDNEGATGGMEMKSMKDSSMEMGEGMKGMKHDGMGMNKAMRDSMMAGTHHIMLEATNAAGQGIASAKVLMLSPSKKSSSVDLMPMMGHFGAGLTLKEKGKYQITVDANAGGVSKTTQFQYTVK
jgi:hypothetical protein